jgi:hypothetical protein
MPNTIKSLDPKLLSLVSGGQIKQPDWPAPPKPSCPPPPSEPTKPWPPANWA